MQATQESTSGVASPANSLVALAVGASVAWTVGEFAFRRSLSAPLSDLLGTPATGYVATLGLGALVLAAAVATLGGRFGIEPGDYGLVPSRRGVLEGVSVVVAYYAFLVATAAVASAVFGVDPNASATSLGFGDAPTWVLAGLLVANGVLAPIAEEIAWRGVVQTAFADALGVTAGIAITAALFAAKHLVVDLAAPPLRVASLVFLAVAYGVLRHRHGTSSSIVAHVLTNTTATLALVLA